MRDYVKPVSAVVAINLMESIARSDGKRYYFNFGEAGYDPVIADEGDYDSVIDKIRDWIAKAK